MLAPLILLMEEEGVEWWSRPSFLAFLVIFEAEVAHNYKVWLLINLTYYILTLTC